MTVRSHRSFAKDILRKADLSHMVNPISSANANSTNEVAQQAARRPQSAAQAQTSSAAPQDKVTLKSTGDLAAGDPDHDGK
jgi:hypothetical protein